MSDETTQPVPTRWLIHDFVVGLWAGTGLGFITGLFVAARVLNNQLLILAGAVLGATSGVYLLTRSHAKHQRFVTPMAIVAWFSLIASTLFIVALIDAVSDLN